MMTGFKSQTFYRRVFPILVLGLALSACSVLLEPVPTGLSTPTVTPTRGTSPLPTAAPSELAAPTLTRPVSPLATPPHGISPLPSATIASPLVTPTAPAPTTAPSPTFTPALPASPSVTPLIAVSTHPRLAPTALYTPPAATRVPALPVPTVVPAPTATPAPTVSPIVVTAWVSDPNPEPGMDVTVFGRLVVNGRPTAGEGMVARWHMKGRDVDCVGDTWVDGTAYCTANTYGLPPDYTVVIEVFIKFNQVPYRAATQLTIR